MSQHRVLRYGSTRAFEDAAGAERMSQQRESIDESTCASENAAYDEHALSYCIPQHCGHTHSSS